MRISIVYWRYCGGEGASISEGSRRAGQKRIRRRCLIGSSRCHGYTGFGNANCQALIHTMYFVLAQAVASSHAVFHNHVLIVITVFHYIANHFVGAKS